MGQPQRQLLQLSHLSYQPPSSQYPQTDTVINRWQASARRDHHPPILVSFDGQKSDEGGRLASCVNLSLSFSRALGCVRIRLGLSRCSFNSTAALIRSTNLPPPGSDHRARRSFGYAQKMVKTDQVIGLLSLSFNAFTKGGDLVP